MILYYTLSLIDIPFLMHVFSVLLNVKINLHVKGLRDEGQRMLAYCPFIMLALFLIRYYSFFFFLLFE